MLGSALIVFREVLEAALIIGIVAAAARGVPRRGWWLTLGVLAGIAGAAAVAAGAAVIGSLADGIGQEILNSAVLYAAVLMLMWHTVWMAEHGKLLAGDMYRAGIDVREGRRESMVLAGLIALAVLREGSETVLFLYSMAVSEGGSFSSMAIGAAIGIGGGALVGSLLYAGMLRIPLRWFFSAMSVLVTLLAAGMASQATGLLIAVDVLPPLANPMWDTSHVLAGDSALGVLLKSLVGYDPRPSGMQLLAWGTVLAVSIACVQWAGRIKSKIAAPASNSPVARKSPSASR